MTRPIDPPIGTVKYGDYTFPAPLKLTVQIVPVYNSADRMVKYRKYLIHLEVILVGNDFPGAGSIPAISAGEALDKSGTDPMRILRRQLTLVGLPLQITAQGLGQDLSFIPSGPTANVVGYGPKPRVLLWEPIGSSQACRLIWDCEVEAIECGTATLGLYNNPLGEFTYSIHFGLSEDGLSTRTATGIIESNPIRLAGLRTALNVDFYREEIAKRLPPLLNYQRTQSYTLSEDRSTLNFTIVDTEEASEHPLYPYVVRARISQRINSINNVFGKWGITFSGDILVAPGWPREVAWSAFVVAIKRRVSSWRQRAQLPPGANRGIGLFPRSIEIEEEIYGGRSMSFSISFEGVTTLRTLLKASGLWIPVPGSWALWRSSMILPRGPHTPRGISQLRFPAGADRLHDFCVVVPVSVPPPAIPAPQLGPTKDPDPEEILPTPSKDDSWYQYDVRATILKSNATIQSRRVGSSDATKNIYVTATGNEIILEPKASMPGDEIVVQERGVSTWTLRLNGIARRYAYKIEPKDLATVATINGKPIPQIEVGAGDVDNWDEACHVDRGFSGPKPMYVTRWQRTYVIDQPDAKFTLTDHPKTQTFK